MEELAGKLARAAEESRKEEVRLVQVKGQVPLVL